MAAIIKKEFKNYFTSIIGYAFLGIFVLVTSIFFGIYNIDRMSPMYAETMSGTLIMFLFLIPALTMRLFADEMRQKTDQLLFTSPLKVSHIVLGKFFAAFMLFAAAMLITMLFPLIMSRYGEIPWSETLCALFGYLLLGACFISIGLFVSSMTESQVVAVVASIAVLFVFFILDALAASVPKDKLSSVIFIAAIIIGLAYLLYNSTKSVTAAGFFACIAGIVVAAAYLINDLLFDSVIYNVLTWFSVLTRFSNFNSGILNVSDIVYYVTFTIAFVYMTVNTIEKRRWK